MEESKAQSAAAADKKKTAEAAPAVRMVIDDLGECTVDDIRCTNCSGRYCGRRNVRVVEGRPLAVCNLKIETIDELAGN